MRHDVIPLCAHSTEILLHVSDNAVSADETIVCQGPDYRLLHQSERLYLAVFRPFITRSGQSAWQG
jgi:hypothetical protein